MQQAAISETALLRVWQILGSPERGAAPLLPISHSAWWQGIREGKYPKGVLLSSRCRVWKYSDIRDLLTRISEGDTNA
jgi:prophage regulatory protein